jgi:hypothetical protein
VNCFPIHACSNFTKTFLNIAKTCIPTREVTIRSDDKVWFDSDLRRESRKRDRGIVSQSITGIESVIKIGSNRDVLLDRASKCVGLFIILTNPLMTRM